MSALSKFGAPMSELSEDDFTSADRMVQLGVEPCRVDLLTGIDGVEFDEAWGNKVGVTVDGLEICVLSRDDLIKNKRAAGREKDRGDVAWLEKNPAGED